MSRFARPTAARLISAAAVVAIAGAGAFVALRALLPADGALAQGLHVGGEPVLPEQSAEAVAQHRAARTLARNVKFRWGEQVALTASLAELGAEVDAEIRGAVERAEARMQANLADAFEHVYAEPTDELRGQREELQREIAAAGEAAHG